MTDFDLPPRPLRKPAGIAADGSLAPQPRRKPTAPASGPVPGDEFVLAAAVPRKPAAAAIQTARAPTMEDFTQSARSAARIANVSFADVLAKAAQESNFNVNARSGSSSAAGPFQFVEQTWLDMIKRHGSAYGLGKEAAQIRMHNGVASVADPALRKRLLDLRKDVSLSSAMAARYLGEASHDLGRVLKRNPTDTESRMAYFLGPGGAAKLIRAAQKDPNGPSDAVLPQAAAANRTLFYGASGPLSNREAMTRITHFISKHLNDFASLGKEEHPVTTDRVVAPDPNVG